MDKVAIFGGTFDPIHLGHTACVRHLVEKMNFSKVFLIPTSKNPLKVKEDPVQKEKRLNMIKLALADFPDSIIVDESELQREEPAYTEETLQNYLEEFDSQQVYLVMGVDTFESFDQWKNYEKILESVNLLVLSRPPYQRPFSTEDFPKGIQPYIYSYERGFCLLKTHRSIEFLKIDTEDISSSEIRKKLKTGKGVSSYLPLDVEKYIVENDVYPRLEPGQIDFAKLTELSGSHLSERAMNAVGYDVRSLDKLYDYTIVASATSTKQAQSLALNLKEKVKEEFGLSPFVSEGMEEGRWVILDYGGLIVHIFYDFVRHEYHLEQLWSEGTRLDFTRESDA